jgi:hypothetical protein
VRSEPSQLPAMSRPTGRRTVSDQSSSETNRRGTWHVARSTHATAGAGHDLMIAHLLPAHDTVIYMMADRAAGANALAIACTVSCKEGPDIGLG